MENLNNMPCNNCCENAESNPPFENFYCPQCDEENKPCETCGPHRPKCCCNRPCFEHDILCGVPACCRPCWDNCKCMDEILCLKKSCGKVKMQINDLNGSILKLENDFNDLDDRLSGQIGDLAEKEERDIAQVYTAIDVAVTNLTQKIDNEEARATAAENRIQNNLDAYIRSNDAALEQERTIRANKDNELGGRIDNLSHALDDEIGRATERENRLQTAIDHLAEDIDDEARDRIAGDNNLQRNIDNEAAARIEEDYAIRQLIRQTDNRFNDYYPKGDTYNKEEVNYILKNIRQFQYKVVDTLPTAGTDTIGYIYLVPSPNPVSQNVKDEYITVTETVGSVDTHRWEQIGTTTVDLSPYSTTAQMNQAIADAVNGEKSRAQQAEAGLGDRITNLTTVVNNLSTTVTNLGNTVSNLQTAINNINSQISQLNSKVLWQVSGSTLTPIDSSKSVTAAGFYDSLM